MKYRYTRYTGDELDGLDIEELVSKLSRLLLDSGFGSASGGPGDPDAEDGRRSEQALRDAILEALLNGGMLSDETILAPPRATRPTRTTTARRGSSR